MSTLRRQLDIATLGRFAAALPLALALAACATPPPPDDPDAVAAYQEANDPLEPLNRGIFEFNLTLDGVLLKPAAQIYRGVVPDEGRKGVSNLLDNWSSPVTFANDLLQGEFDRATVTLGRFFINTGFGFLGVIDVVDYLGGDPGHDEDFGQTLAVRGAGEGPYLMLPIYGPSNPRDAAGLAIDFFIDPLTYLLRGEAADLIFGGATAVDRRERHLDELDDVEKTSIDLYAAIRSLYRQNRASEVRNGEPDLESLADEELIE